LDNLPLIVISNGNNDVEVEMVVMDGDYRLKALQERYDQATQEQKHKYKYASVVILHPSLHIDVAVLFSCCKCILICTYNLCRYLSYEVQIL